MEPTPSSILVIDADTASRNYLASMLKKNGYSVFSAALGREGLISAWRDLPQVILLDSSLPDITGLELVTRLRQDRRTSKVIMFTLSNREDPQDMAALLAAGCSEYLVKSSQTVQELLELIPRYLSGGLNVPKKQGTLISFMSAKGGTGTSSLCANIAMCLASDKMDKKVALIDLVLPIGSIANIVGYADRFNLVTASMLAPEQLTAAYFKDNLPRVSGWYFNLLAGAPDPGSANRLPGERVGDILKAIQGSYDYVFVDLGRSLSRISIPIIQKSDLLALILSTDLATAELTLTVLEYLKGQGVSSEHIYPIQNRAIGLEGLTKPELERKLSLPIGITMPYMGDNVTVANNRHEPLATRLQNDSSILMLKQAATYIADLDKHRVH
ncbi:MAG TPA: response regulator [Anaerolineales bacterium]|nr:response regulator [Anaerolineales bacterium]